VASTTTAPIVRRANSSTPSISLRVDVGCATATSAAHSTRHNERNRSPLRRRRRSCGPCGSPCVPGRWRRPTAHGCLGPATAYSRHSLRTEHRLQIARRAVRCGDTPRP
jgi:hypothetical protein